MTYCSRWGSREVGCRRGSARGWAWSLVLLVVAGPTAWAGGDAVQIRVVEDTGERIVLDYTLGAYELASVEVNGKTYTQVRLDGEASLKVVGAPELPSVCRSIIIPGDAAMAIRVVHSEVEVITDVDVISSKGFILRCTDPGTVPYTFGPAYETDAYYPGSVASLREPYILRNYRGTVVQLNPFQYNPITRTLRVHRRVTVEVYRDGASQRNVLRRAEPPEEKSLAFHQIYKHHFLNYRPPLRYEPLDEEGEMLIIYHDPWLANIQPLIDHKNSIGIATTAVPVSEIGTSVSQIKAYIQEVYDTSDLAFVLLVGDGAQIASPSSAGGSSDPTYSKLAGTDDYPDILVGRFSAETAAQVDTQVERTITYESMPATEQEWFRKGTGVASNQGPGDDGEYDDEHMDNIREDLLAYGYTEVDRIYDFFGTAAMVRDALNEGRGIVNYTGHGSATEWGSTGFSISDVNDLTNDDVLPFIFSVACLNGQFEGRTCFGEAWLRATHDSVPTGAIGTYMSSILQSWDPPMAAQDESNDLLVAEAYFSFGALCFGGSCLMMDEYGYGGVEMFDTWHVFGDPSVRVFGTAYRPAVKISLPGGPPKYIEPRRSSTITVLIEDGEEMVVPESATIHYQMGAGDSFDSSRMTPLGDNLYEAVLPGPACDAEPAYYFSATGDGGTTDYYPRNAPEEAFTALVATVVVAIDDNFEMDQGWDLQNEDLLDGAWQRGTPAGDGSRGDPVTDFDESGQCYVTANRAGNSDVDGGPTRLISPLLDVSGVPDPVLKYARWFYNDDEDEDRLVVELSDDGGSTWTLVESVGWWGGEPTWVPVTVHVSDYVSLTDQLKVRFTVADNPNNSVTEAGIDAVEVVDISCSMGADGDYDFDGDVDVADFAGFARCMDGPADGTCGLAFDFDEDGQITLADYAPFAGRMTGPRG